MFNKIESLMAGSMVNGVQVGGLASKEYTIRRYNTPKNKVGWVITFYNPINEIEGNTLEEVISLSEDYLQSLIG